MKISYSTSVFHPSCMWLGASWPYPMRMSRAISFTEEYYEQVSAGKEFEDVPDLLAGSLALLVVNFNCL